MNAENKPNFDLLSEYANRASMNRIGWFLTGGTVLSYVLDQGLYGSFTESPLTAVGLGLTIASVLGSVSLNYINRARNLAIESILPQPKMENWWLQLEGEMVTDKLNDRPGPAH